MTDDQITLILRFLDLYGGVYDQREAATEFEEFGVWYDVWTACQ